MKKLLFAILGLFTVYVFVMLFYGKPMYTLNISEAELIKIKNNIVSQQKNSGITDLEKKTKMIVAGFPIYLQSAIFRELSPPIKRIYTGNIFSRKIYFESFKDPSVESFKNDLATRNLLVDLVMQELQKMGKIKDYKKKKGSTLSPISFSFTLNSGFYESDKGTTILPDEGNW